MYLIDRLTNGHVAIGCMETVDKMVERPQHEEVELLTDDEWYFRRAKLAAIQDNKTLWHLVVRVVEDKVSAMVDVSFTTLCFHMDPYFISAQLMNVNSVDDEYGNTLLHLASGCECFVDRSDTFRWGKPARRHVGWS